MKSHTLIYYDGHCPFCNFWVRQLCHFDAKDAFRFSPLQKASKELLSTVSGEALVVITQKQEVKEGVHAIFYALEQQKSILNVFLLFKLLPKRLTKKGYESIAKRRYQWFGKYDQCPLIEQRHRHKFIG